MADAGQVDVKVEEKQRLKGPPAIILGILGALACLYVFLVGLQLLGDAFKCLGGKGAGGMFSAIENPIAGLMTGILGTVLVQSSSTSTSIVVGLVGAGQLGVKTGIPIIMGANIGTSVTNTLVSMGQVGDRIMLQRAFAGATVHDAFNLLTVATLLPIELIIGAMEGDGGPLYWLSKVMADSAMESGEKGDNPLKDKSPIKLITKPVAKAVISNNKYIINALALGAPEARAATQVNQTVCKPLPATRRLDVASWEDDGAGAPARDLLTPRRLDERMDCSQYFCVSKDLDKNFKKISKSAYAEKLTACDGHVAEAEWKEGCGKDKCYLDAGKYFKSYVEEKGIVKGGFVKGAGDAGGGIIALILSLILLSGGLFCLCKVLHWLFSGSAKRAVVWAVKLNDYLALLVGVVITIIAQSSSVTTSALTPLCGLGLIPLTKMLPMTLGANIGTTCTALIASIASFTHGAIQIALCHLLFNIIGILIWFPVPIMRRVPLGAARLLGLYASFYRFVPALYILVAFVVVPGVALGISALFDASVAGGVVVLLLVLGALGGFEFWWIRMGGCYKVLSAEQRETQQEALEADDARVRGESPA